MHSNTKSPCDEAQILSADKAQECAEAAKPWVLWSAILGSSLAFINGSSVNVALPAMQEAFDASVSGMQWIVNSYAIVLGALILVGGSSGDKFGRKRIFNLGIWIFLFSSIWCGLAPNLDQLIIARILQGVGGALLIPNSLALISSAFRKEERGKAIGTWSAFSVIGAVIGPIIAGVLVDTISWRPIFYLNIPIAIAALFMVYSKVPEFKSENNFKLDWIGAVMAVVGLGVFSYGLIQASEFGFDLPEVWGTMLFGIVLFLGFILFERKIESPMVPMRIFSSKSFSGANALTLFLYFALTAFFFIMPFNLIQVKGYSATIAGMSFLPFTIVMATLSRWAGGLVDRIGARIPLIIGPALAGFGFILLAIFSINESFWIAFFPGLIVIGLGMVISVSPLTTVVMTSVSDDDAGTASGVNNAVSRMAAMLSVAVIGVIAVQLFTQDLISALGEINMDENLRSMVLEQNTRLAGIEIPTSVDASTGKNLRSLINLAFLNSYKYLMFGAAVFAFISSAISAAFIEGKQN